MQLSKKQEAIIIGTLLGDGCLERNGKYVRLRLEHGISQGEYLLWKYRELKNVITGKVMRVNAFHKKNNKNYESLRIYTYSHGVFEKFWHIFYKNRKKFVPLNISELLNTPLALAVWFMDDGYKRNDCNAFRLNSEAFNKQEQIKLCRMLKNNFGIDVTLHKKGKFWNIYVPQKSAKKFVEIVKPFILPNFQYKIALAP